MIPPLRIAIAEDEPNMFEFLHEALVQMKHQIVVLAQTGRALVDLCKANRPDLVITDIKLPDIDGIEAATEVYKCSPVPIIIISAFHDEDCIVRALDDHVMAYLVKPITREDLEPAIALAMRRFEQFQALHTEAADLRQALADRKIIERAKGVLMKQGGLDEHEAFRRLQNLARSHNQKLVEVAQLILSVGDVFQPPAPGSPHG